MTTAKTIWDNFCSDHQIIKDGVPLFASDEHGFVMTKEIGQTLKRKLLVRHPDMERLVLRETDILIRDFQGVHQYDGLIYMMHRRTDDGCSVLPLYIGKAETIGRHGKLSANLCNLHNRKDKFARWGDNYEYHIGDLSAATLTGHAVEKRIPKYSEWASKIFKNVETQHPQLAFNVYFWAKAWNKITDVGIWSELSPTRLAFLEYLMIGVASTIFGDFLLNHEGRNRALARESVVSNFMKS